MNWKPTLVGAVVVIALGLAAGLAIGGKTETKTVTAAAKTVVKTVTVAAGEPVSDDGDGTDTTATTPDDGGTETDGDPTFLGEGDAAVNPGDGIFDVETGVNASLQRGSELSDATVWSFELGYEGETPDDYQMELPVPDGKTDFQAKIGFEKGMPSGNSVKVEFRKDEPRGEVLKELRLSATETADVDVPLDGTATLVVKYVPVEDAWNEPTDGPLRFVFGEAHFG